MKNLVKISVDYRYEEPDRMTWADNLLTKF